MTRRTKYRFVSVPAYVPVTPAHLVRSYDVGRSALFATPDGHEGEYSSLDYGRTWRKTVNQDVQLSDVAVDEAVKRLQDAAHGMDNPYLEVDVEYYDCDESSSYVVSRVRGLREATPEEVKTLLAYEKWRVDDETRTKELAKQRLIDDAKKLGITAADLA